MKAAFWALVLLTFIAAGAAETTPVDLSSYGASIRYGGSMSINSSPTEAAIGTGYYSDRPLGRIGSAGGRTSIKGGNTLMTREIGNAYGIDGGMDLSAGESRLQTGSGVTGGSTVQMNIDETVTDGSVHIGVLQGREGFAAWKDPVIEVDEDYVGTYHIVKNMTIEAPYSRTIAFPAWLPCCISSGAYTLWELPRGINAEEIFGAV